MVEFGGKAMHVHEDGLSAEFWGISIALGVGSLPVQQIINIFFKCANEKHSNRNEK